MLSTLNVLCAFIYFRTLIRTFFGGAFCCILITKKITFTGLSKYKELSIDKNQILFDREEKYITIYFFSFLFSAIFDSSIQPFNAV